MMCHCGAWQQDARSILWDQTGPFGALLLLPSFRTVFDVI